MENLGKWIKEKYGTQGAFAEELGVQQSRVSKWLGGEPVPKAYQEKIRDLKYKGTWPKEAAQEGAGETIPAAVFHREIGKLEGRVETLERTLERLGEIVRSTLPGSGESHPRGRT